MSYDDNQFGVHQAYQYCGWPQATPDEVSGWNELVGGASFTGTLKLGLFGYDISCVASICAQFNNVEGTGYDYTGYCTLIQARGLDGLAFGFYAQFEGTDYYCAGFRNDEPGNRVGGNTAICTDENDMETYYWYQFY